MQIENHGNQVDYGEEVFRIRPDVGALSRPGYSKQGLTKYITGSKEEAESIAAEFRNKGYVIHVEPEGRPTTEHTSVTSWYIHGIRYTQNRTRHKY